MSDTTEPPRTRPALAWGQSTRTTESGSFIDDQIAALVDPDADPVAASAGRFRLDVIHLDQDVVGS